MATHIENKQKMNRNVEKLVPNLCTYIDKKKDTATTEKSNLKTEKSNTARKTKKDKNRNERRKKKEAKKT
jgi:hypothetical protein